jgi:hypothetical protein
MTHSVLDIAADRAALLAVLKSGRSLLMMQRAPEVAGLGLADCRVPGRSRSSVVSSHQPIRSPFVV